MPLELPDEVLFKTVGDEIVLLNLQSGIYYGLDPVGSRFWRLLEEHDFDGAIDAMEREFEVDRETLAQDCRELLDELREKGLVK
jgi:coenzyme PQQ synthesis protein D (PqqD)